MEEEVITLPEADKDSGVLRRASAERVVNDGVYPQTVEDIEQGKDSGERLYLARYTGGDIEHLTADQVRQWSRTVENGKDNGEPTQKSIDFVKHDIAMGRPAGPVSAVRGVAQCWHGDACPWHKRSMCFFGHSSPGP